jgi:Domain of unknown function (DUF4326)
MGHALTSHCATTNKGGVNALAVYAPGKDRIVERMQAIREAPRRLQIRRSKGWRMPANTVKIDRSTVFGNPFLTVEYGPRSAALYRAWISGARLGVWVTPGRKKTLARRRLEILRALPNLRGKNLACWCPLPSEGQSDPCHGAVLLDLANR